MAVVAFQTDVEVLRDVPLSARRDAVVAPVERSSTAVGGSDEGDGIGTTSCNVGAHHAGGGTAVADVGVSADKRRTQARCPEVLVSRLTAPRGGQLDFRTAGRTGRGCRSNSARPAVHAILEPAHAKVGTLLVAEDANATRTRRCQS